jgi:hypothetical protein
VESAPSIKQDKQKVGEIMIEAICDCGAVRLEVAHIPAEVNDCQCPWCQRLGSLWAYYPKDQVRIVSNPDSTAIYLRAQRRLEFHRCKVCGLTTHWINTDQTKPTMGVNARLMPPDVRTRARVIQGK